MRSAPPLGPDRTRHQPRSIRLADVYGPRADAPWRPLAWRPSTQRSLMFCALAMVTLVSCARPPSPAASVGVERASCGTSDPLCLVFLNRMSPEFETERLPRSQRTAPDLPISSPSFTKSRRSASRRDPPYASSTRPRPRQLRTLRRSGYRRTEKSSSTESQPTSKPLAVRSRNCRGAAVPSSTVSIPRRALRTQTPCASSSR
jgi:hypothetical protein